MRHKLLDSSSAIMQARECVADAALLKDDKNYYKSRLTEVQAELAHEREQN